MVAEKLAGPFRRLLSESSHHNPQLILPTSPYAAGSSGLSSTVSSTRSSPNVSPRHSGYRRLSSEQHPDIEFLMAHPQQQSGSPTRRRSQPATSGSSDTGTGGDAKKLPSIARHGGGGGGDRRANAEGRGLLNRSATDHDESFTHRRRNRTSSNNSVDGDRQLFQKL